MSAVTCLVCDRAVAESEREAVYRPAYFDDVCVCTRCVTGEREGYGHNAESVHEQLARIRANRIQESDPGHPREAPHTHG